eukprot:174399-Chlamydomonas_euryale.AAC.1
MPGPHRAVLTPCRAHTMPCPRAFSRRSAYCASRSLRFSVSTSFSCRSCHKRSASAASCADSRASSATSASDCAAAAADSAARCCSDSTFRRRASRSRFVSMSSARCACATAVAGVRGAGAQHVLPGARGAKRDSGPFIHEAGMSCRAQHWWRQKVEEAAVRLPAGEGGAAIDSLGFKEDGVGWGQRRQHWGRGAVKGVDERLGMRGWGGVYRRWHWGRGVAKGVG